MAYNKETDLDIYVQNRSDMGVLTPYIAEATEEIDRHLKSAGLTADQIADDLSEDTLDHLKPASCFYVLYLYYQRFEDVENLERSQHFLARFKEVMSTLTIEIDADADGEPEQTFVGGGRLKLG